MLDGWRTIAIAGVLLDHATAGILRRSSLYPFFRTVPLYLGATRLHTLVLLFLLWPIMNVSIAGFLLHVVQSPWRILNIRPIVWLGKISYSLYLWQELFAYGPHGRFWYDPLFAVGLACVSYYLIEQPMLRLRERRTKGQRPEMPAPMANSAEGRQVDLGTAAGF